ncbi:MAG: hypothetical protein IJH39_07955 [Clostridia bacterium]|nr:hypothetical protein [Clostridia bacterium]
MKNHKIKINISDDPIPYNITANIKKIDEVIKNNNERVKWENKQLEVIQILSKEDMEIIRTYWLDNRGKLKKMYTDYALYEHKKNIYYNININEIFKELIKGIPDKYLTPTPIFDEQLRDIQTSAIDIFNGIKYGDERKIPKCQLEAI